LKQTFGLAVFLDFGINKRATCKNVQQQNREKKMYGNDPILRFPDLISIQILNKIKN